MEKIKLQVSGSQIQVVQRPAAITAGTVGLEVEFAFDSHWDNLGKTVIFRAGDKIIATALERDTHIVPWEVLEKPDLWLVVGVYGANPEGTVVIPTLWTKVAAVYTGVEPEGDPALEPANPIWQETLARVADMEPQLRAHINNADNPHGISCDQIGAVTQKEFREVVSNLDGSSDPEQLIPHLLNRDNPHGVTAAQAGAAPNGYGLGEKVTPTTAWRYSSASGFSRSSNDSPDGKLWWGITSTRDSGVGTQVAFSDAGGILTEARRIYKTSGQMLIGEWEYVNPPMLEGVEYRTTERFNGMPVYVKLINGGLLASSGSKFVTLSEEAVNIIEVKGFLTRDGESGYFPLPRFNTNGSLSAFVYAAYTASNAETVANIISTENMSNYTAFLTVKYTKNATA